MKVTLFGLFTEWRLKEQIFISKSKYFYVLVIFIYLLSTDYINYIYIRSWLMNKRSRYYSYYKKNIFWKCFTTQKPIGITSYLCRYIDFHLYPSSWEWSTCFLMVNGFSDASIQEFKFLLVQRQDREPWGSCSGFLSSITALEEKTTEKMNVLAFPRHEGDDNTYNIYFRKSGI